MKRIAFLLSVLLASSAEASTRVLLLEDIGSPDADFSWSKVYDGQVEFYATVARPTCWNFDCFDVHSTGALAGFKRESRDIYYVGDGDRPPIPCGKTDGLFADARLNENCRVSVEPERVCEAWFSGNDCVESATRFRVYLDIDAPELVSGAGPSPGHPGGH